MALLESCTSLSKTFGPRVLFENISLGISEGERLGLIGPNGSGKSTLLKILAGKMEADSGSISMRRNTRVGYVPQQVSFPPQLTAAEVIAAAIAGERLDDLERAARINQTLGRAGFTDGAAPAETLSGGWKRRLAIARELALDPDLLFLDEPTNHLDLEGILWLERLLASASFASVVVSHDRYFLDNVVNDMAEINRVYPEGLFRVDGGYSQFLEKKEEFLLAQSSRQESLANKVRREVEWLRRGPKARTGKSRARIDEAGRLMRELSGLEARAPRRRGANRLHRHRPPHQAPGLRRSRLQGPRRTHAVPRSQPDPHARHAPRAARAERHRQDHFAADPERRARAGFRPHRARRRSCAPSTSTRRASSSTRTTPCARALAPTAIP